MIGNKFIIIDVIEKLLLFSASFFMISLTYMERIFRKKRG